MELTLVGPSIEPVSTESGKDFPDVGRVLLRIVGVYQDIIQVYYYRDVNHVSEDVHEPLETHWGIGEPLGHHQPLERPVPGPKSGLPFVAIGDVDKVVGMSQVNLGIDLGLAQSI